jgi:hypothetical protein
MAGNRRNSKDVTGSIKKFLNRVNGITDMSDLPPVPRHPSEYFYPSSPAQELTPELVRRRSEEPLPPYMPYAALSPAEVRPRNAGSVPTLNSNGESRRDQNVRGPKLRVATVYNPTLRGKVTQISMVRNKLRWYKSQGIFSEFTDQLASLDISSEVPVPILTVTAIKYREGIYADQSFQRPVDLVVHRGDASGYLIATISFTESGPAEELLAPTIIDFYRTDDTIETVVQEAAVVPREAAYERAFKLRGRKFAIKEWHGWASKREYYLSEVLDASSESDALLVYTDGDSADGAVELRQQMGVDMTEDGIVCLLAHKIKLGFVPLRRPSIFNT